MKALENVVVLSRGTIYEIIFAFLNDQTPKTSKAYERDIRSFFRYRCNKDIEQLTRSDLNITHAEMQAYKNHLKQSNADVTVNRKLSVIRQLYKTLKQSIPNFTNDLGIDLISSVNVKGIRRAKANSYGHITYEEYLAILNAVEKQYKGEQKRLFIEVAFWTSFRLNAMRSIKWRDIAFEPKDNIYIITVTDKGNEERAKGIPVELYNRLHAARWNEYDTQGLNALVFSLVENTIGKMIEDACEAVGIDHEGRNIVFHSIRKLGITMTYEITGDLKAASEQGDHKDVNNTRDFYIPRGKKADSPLLSTSLDFSIFRNMSKEELLELIENKIDHTTRVRLYRAATK